MFGDSEVLQQRINHVLEEKLSELGIIETLLALTYVQEDFLLQELLNVLPCSHGQLLQRLTALQAQRASFLRAQGSQKVSTTFMLADP